MTNLNDNAIIFSWSTFLRAWPGLDCRGHLPGGEQGQAVEGHQAQVRGCPGGGGIRQLNNILLTTYNSRLYSLVCSILPWGVLFRVWNLRQNSP